MDAVLGTFFWASAVAIGVPLLLAGLGELIAERAGVFTVGLEGFLLAGAFAAVAVSAVGVRGWGAVLTAGAVVAGLGALYGLVVVYARADQVVVGIGVNLVVLGLTSMFRRQWFPHGMPSADTSGLADVPVPALASIPWVGPVLFDQSPLVYLAYLLVPVAGVVLWRTRWGLQVRAVGDSADAAAAHGLPVLRVRFVAMVVNGFLGGLAGAALVLLQAGGTFVDGMVNGRGYLVLALVMFARWRPGWAAVVAVVFGAADTLQYIGQSIVGDQVPSALFLMAPFVLALVAWVALGSRFRGIGDLGRPYLG